MAFPFLLRTGEEWPSGMRPDVLGRVGDASLLSLSPAPQWPRYLTPPSRKDAAVARERATTRAEWRVRAAREYMLQMQARADRARDTAEADYVGTALAAAALEVQASEEWLRQLESDASLGEMSITPRTCYVTRLCTQRPLLEQVARLNPSPNPSPSQP